MNSVEEELVFEERMDDIAELMEELILDAILSALKKIRDRNIQFNEIAKRQPTDDNFF